MPELHFPWIEVAIMLPLLGAVVVGLTRNVESARKRCIAVSALTLSCTRGEWIDFNSLHTFEAHDHWDMVEAIFHRDIFVIDELSAPLLPLTLCQSARDASQAVFDRCRRIGTDGITWYWSAGYGPGCCRWCGHCLFGHHP